MDYEQLYEAVAGAAVGVRSNQHLQPAQGQGGKVFPPTYGVRAGRTKYAFEERVVDGDRVQAVLLDSVASQANRFELALLDAWESDELRLPVPYVDFGGHDGVADVDRISVLEAPHRVADAIFRDSLLDGTLFRLTDAGRAITEASSRDATGLFTYSPTALLFGMWDSTGPKGGLGSKFQRAIVSEIVGIDAEPGVTVSSRIDPLAIEREAATIYTHADPNQEWTLDPDEARTDDKGNPVKFSRSGTEEQPGRPSMINHGNVTPSIDGDAGGVTFDYALQTSVLSFAALRKLRFVHDAEGRPLPRERHRQAETAARSVLAAIGLAAMTSQYELDYDLRSRCVLVPQEPFSLELLQRDGSPAQPFHLDSEGACQLVREAADAAADHGLTWPDHALVLEPTPKLVELLRQSRRLAADEVEVEE
jgi:CRISPR-associated protein Csb1